MSSVSVIHDEKKYLEKKCIELWEQLMNLLSRLSRIRENELHGLGTNEYKIRRRRVRKVDYITQKYLPTSDNTTNQNSEDAEVWNYVQKLIQEIRMLRKLIETFKSELARFRNSTQQQDSESSSGEDDSIVSSPDCLPVIDDPPSMQSFVRDLDTDDEDDDDRLNSTRVGANIGRFIIIIESDESHSVSKIIDEKIIDGIPQLTVELYKPVSHHSYTFVKSDIIRTINENDMTLWLGDAIEIRSGLKFPHDFNSFRIHH